MLLPRTLPSSFALPENASICILRLSAIGDVCHAVSMVGRIRQQRPDISIVWVVGKIEYSLLEGMDGVEFVVYDKKAGKQAREHVRETLAQRKFDALCVMQVALRANWLSRVINAEIRLGFDKAHSKEGHSLFINRRVAPLSQPHVLEGFHAFADALGIAKTDKLMWPIAVSEADQQKAKAMTQSAGAYVALCPAASKLERSWLPERYAAVADYCHKKGYSVVLCGGPGPLDKHLEEAILASSQAPIESIVGKTSLKQMFCVLKEASLVIAPDTGPAHMATAAGTPVVGLYAHSNPRRTGPYLSLASTLNAYDTHIKNQTGKSWEHLKWGTRAKGDALMQAISVESVKSVIDEVLGKN